MKPAAWPTGLVAAALLLALALGLATWTRGFTTWTHEGRRQALIAEGALQAPPVLLKGTADAPLALWPAAGPRAYLVDFIYTRCPGICRALGSEFQQMQRALQASPGAGAPPVRLVSLAIDRDHDDAPARAAWAAQWRADPRYWTVATAAQDDAQAALLRALGVVVVPDGLGGYVHNGDIHLLDAHGRLRGLYTLSEWPAALAAARALAAGGA